MTAEKATAEPVQDELDLYRERERSENVEWFVAFLEGREWTTAAQVLGAIGRPATEGEKRKVRAWADASEGRVCGHQRGYKLVKSMTGEEYGWWRNEALKAVDSVRRRVVESDRVFYGRAAVQ